MPDPEKAYNGYALTFIFSPYPSVVKFQVSGCDFRLYVNGASVLTRSACLVQSEKKEIRVALLRGTNKILLRLGSVRTDFNFVLQVSSVDGQPLPCLGLGAGQHLLRKKNFELVFINLLTDTSLPRFLEVGGSITTDNFALGSFAFTSSSTDPAYFINDAKYGPASSWSFVPSPSTGVSAFVGVRFQSAVEISSVAWGRDNTHVRDNSFAGTYTVQYSVDPEVDETSEDVVWTTLLTTFLPEGTPQGSVRHVYPIYPTLVNGIRLVVEPSTPLGIVIDELEVYGHVYGMT